MKSLRGTKLQKTKSSYLESNRISSSCKYYNSSPSPTDAEVAPVLIPDVVARASTILDVVLALASSAPLVIAPGTVGHAPIYARVVPPSATASAPAARESADDDDAFPTLAYALLLLLLLSLLLLLLALPLFLLMQHLLLLPCLHLLLMHLLL